MSTFDGKIYIFFIFFSRHKYLVLVFFLSEYTFHFYSKKKRVGGRAHVPGFTTESDVEESDDDDVGNGAKADGGNDDDDDDDKMDQNGASDDNESSEASVSSGDDRDHDLVDGMYESDEGDVSGDDGKSGKSGTLY